MLKFKQQQKTTKMNKKYSLETKNKIQDRETLFVIILTMLSIFTISSIFTAMLYYFLQFIKN